MQRDPHAVPAPLPVILTKVRTQGNQRLPFVASGTDFRHDHGVGVFGRRLHV
jgi:hypothetical protein